MKSTGNQTNLYGQNFFWFSASFFLLFLASKSLGLTLGYGLDDYVLLNSSESQFQGFLLSVGRFTSAILQSLMDYSGLKQPELAGIGFFLSLGGLLLISWVTLARWLEKDLFFAIAVGALLGAHPFFAEYVTFRQSLFGSGVYLALIAGATILLATDAPETISRLSAAAALAAIASGINQIAMAFFCIAVLGISFQKNTHLSPFRSLIFAIKRTTLIGTVSSIFYLVIFGVTIRMANVDLQARMSMLGFGEIGGRFSDVATLLTSIFGGSHPLVGPIAAICTAVALAVLGFRASTRYEEWMYVLTGWSVLALGIVLALLPTSLSAVWWPVPRTLIALPLAVALGVSILSCGASRVQVRAASVAILIAVAIFSAKSGALLLDQQRLNRWDIGLAREIILRISESRQIDATSPIVIHRARWAYEIDKGMPIGDANTSAFSVVWAVDALFEEASGRQLNVKLAVQGDTICDNSPFFPNSGSIHEVGGAVHICL